MQCAPVLPTPPPSPSVIHGRYATSYHTRRTGGSWRRGENELVTFSWALAYAWICSLIAAVVLSFGSLTKGKQASKLEHNNQILQLQQKDKEKDKKLDLHKNVSPPSNLKRKTLILDLDETLVHSTIKTVTHHHITVDVVIDGLTCTFYVIKRPHVDLFLKKVAEWFDVVIFTASMQQYADPLIDQLDTSRLVKGRLFRESCLPKDGNFIKDLTVIGQDLTSTIIVDNSPIAYSNNKENALPIENWMGDNPSDDALLNLLPFLNALRFTSDVRSILSLRGN
jgi:Dullard-like phosphatase family protein